MHGSLRAWPCRGASVANRPCLVALFQFGAGRVIARSRRYALAPGAYRDDITGACSEDLTQSDCESTARRYGGVDSECATINPPCLPPPPTGACCDDDTGMCTDDVTQSHCESTARRYGGDGSDCTTIGPPCASPAIPAASVLGVIVLALILLVAGKVLFGSRVAPNPNGVKE